MGRGAAVLVWLELELVVGVRLISHAIESPRTRML